LRKDDLGLAEAIQNLADGVKAIFIVRIPHSAYQTATGTRPGNPQCHLPLFAQHC